MDKHEGGGRIRSPRSVDVSALAVVVRMRRVLRFGLPLAAFVVIGANTPSIAQRLPRYALPIVAGAGAVLIVISFARLATRLVRRRSAEGRLPLVPLIINALALLFLVLLPAAHLLRALTPPRPGTARIHTGFGDWLGSEGYPRLSPHRGIDVAGQTGADVLASADGRVTVARDNRDLCGLIVVIDHDPHGLRTVYCHFSAIAVRVGDDVRRGQRIGTVGTSGQRAFPGFEHVHLELQRGRDVNALEDPAGRIVGCFDEAASYPADRLALTYPVKC